MTIKLTKKEREANSYDGYLLRLNETRRRLHDYQMPELDRQLFWDLLTSAISETIEKCDELQENANLGVVWTIEDDARLVKYLDGKKPKTWEETRIIEDELVRMFRRPWRILKRKAWALNLRSAVDYWHNRYP